MISGPSSSRTATNTCTLQTWPSLRTRPLSSRKHTATAKCACRHGTASWYSPKTLRPRTLLSRPVHSLGVSLDVAVGSSSRCDPRVQRWHWQRKFPGCGAELDHVSRAFQGLWLVLADQLPFQIADQRCVRCRTTDTSRRVSAKRFTPAVRRISTNPRAGPTQQSIRITTQAQQSAMSPPMSGAGSTMRRQNLKTSRFWRKGSGGFVPLPLTQPEDPSSSQSVGDVWSS